MAEAMPDEGGPAAAEVAQAAAGETGENQPAVEG